MNDKSTYVSMHTLILHTRHSLNALLRGQTQVEYDLGKGAAYVTIAHRVVNYLDLLRLYFDALFHNTIQQCSRLCQELAIAIN